MAPVYFNSNILGASGLLHKKNYSFVLTFFKP